MTIQELASFLEAQYTQYYSHYNYDNRYLRFSPINPENPRLTMIDWVNLTTRMLNEFYPDNQFIGNFESNSLPVYGARVYLNEEFKTREQLRWVKNITKLEFNKLYPSLMVQLYESGEMTFNNTKFGELYSFIIKNYSEIRRYFYNLLPQNFLNVSHLLKFYINYTYGVLGNGRFIECNNLGLVTEKCRNMLDSINDRYSNNVIYIDTDTIFFYKINQIPDVQEYLNQFDLEYELYDGYEGIFHERKRYIIYKDGQVQLHGVREFETRQESRLKREKRLSKKIELEETEETNFEVWNDE